LLSPADVIIIGAVALIVFGPDQLPKVARRAGQVVRDVQNTSQTFIREMERAADENEHKEWVPPPAVEHYADPTPATGHADAGLTEPGRTESGHADPIATVAVHVEPVVAHEPGAPGLTPREPA
jgi:Sec-independent protein translocase protein TatA